MTLRFKITTTPNLDKIAAAYRPVQEETVDHRMEVLATIIHRNIVNEAPERSGNLRKSIKLARRGKFTQEIFIDRRTRGGKYERAIRLGLPAEKINPIRPKKKKALFWPGLPHPIKAVYNHPGIKPNPYFERGLDKSQADMNRAEQLIGSDIVEKLTEKF